MPDTTVQAPPFAIVKPYIRIGPVDAGVEFACAASNLEVNADQDETTVDTFCGSFVNYKAVKWVITVSAYESYGANGLWTLLSPFIGTLQPFEVRPDEGIESVDNPSMTGNARVKAFPFISGGPGEPGEFDIELAVQGAPAFSTGGATQAASAPTPEPEPAAA